MLREEFLKEMRLCAFSDCVCEGNVPGTYVVLNNGNLVLEFWTGKISHEEVIAHERRHLSDPSINPGASVLADAMRATFKSTADEVKEITGLYGRVSGRLRVGRVALLVNQDAYERAVLFLKEAQGYGVNVIVFSAIDIACTWLGTDAEMVHAQLKVLQSQSSRPDSSSTHS